MISIRAFTAFALPAASANLTPRASGGGASDGGLTNPFVGAIASGKIDPGGDVSTDGFARSHRFRDVQSLEAGHPPCGDVSRAKEGRPVAVEVRFHTGGQSIEVTESKAITILK